MVVCPSRYVQGATPGALAWGVAPWLRCQGAAPTVLRPVCCAQGAAPRPRRAGRCVQGAAPRSLHAERRAQGAACAALLVMVLSTLSPGVHVKTQGPELKAWAAEMVVI